MGDATLNDVIARMDRIETALTDLTAAIRAMAVAPPAKAAPARAPAAKQTAKQAASGPPRVKVAPPQGALAKGGGGSVTTPAEKKAESLGASRTMPGEDQAFDPYADRDDIILPPADASILQVMTHAFEALLLDDAEDTWAHMAKLTHSEQLIGPRALDHYKAFTWHKARRTAHKYLADGNPASFDIDYTQPAEVTDEVNRVKIFLKKAGGMPAPVAFERDPRDGNAWRVAGMSL